MRRCCGRHEEDDGWTVTQSLTRQLRIPSYLSNWPVCLIGTRRKPRGPFQCSTPRQASCWLSFQTWGVREVSTAIDKAQAAQEPWAALSARERSDMLWNGTNSGAAIRMRSPGHKASDGHSPAVVPPPPMSEGCVSRAATRSGCVRLPGNSPHEAEQLARYRRPDHCRLLASSAQHPIAGRQSGLRLTGDLSHPWRRLLQTIQLLRADSRRML